MRPDVVVVGAGLAGLTAAIAAARAGAGVELFDVRIPGGRAGTEERGGFRLNRGPHALYRAGPAWTVLSELGVDLAGGPPSTDVSGFRGGTMVRLPTSGTSLLRSTALGWRSKVRLARLLMTLPRLDTTSVARLSASQWVESCSLPPDGATVLRTLLRVSSYADDLDAVSADAVLRQIQLVLAGGVQYLDGGWGRIVLRLLEVARAAGVRIESSRRVTALTASGSDWSVTTSSGPVETGAVVVAVGGPDAARALIPGRPDWSTGHEATAACLDLGLRRPPRWPVVFGLEDPLYLSMHAPPADLAPPGHYLVHLLRYGATTRDGDRASLWALARAAGIDQDQVVVERFLPRMTVSHSLPRPGPGLAGRPPVAVTGRSGLFLAGDWVGPVGLLADASVGSGQEAGCSAARHSAPRHSAPTDVRDAAPVPARSAVGLVPGAATAPGGVR